MALCLRVEAALTILPGGVKYTVMHLDRTAFFKQSFDSAADHQRTYRQMSWEERGRSFRYLMGVNFGFAANEWPRMDKTAFQVRTQK